MCFRSQSEGEKQSSEIDRLIKNSRKTVESEIKLLLLGAGDSGKSTIAKQLRIIHLEGYSEDELRDYAGVVIHNVVTSMKNILKAGEYLDGITETLSTEQETVRDRLVSDTSFDGKSVSDEMKDDLQFLWETKYAKEIYSRASEFQIQDSAAYFLNDLPRIVDPDYCPTQQDLLFTRAKTTGIIELEFEVDDTVFRLIDVGGQRSERKKWMHCFQDVTCIIFCVALSEYDQKLYEDNTTNRMQESLALWKEICNTEWFHSTAMIVFLNKKDLFEEKIKTVDLNVCFSDYDGGCDYTKASNYIQEIFLEQNENPKKKIYPHLTCATDTENIDHVFNAVKDIILHKALQDSGLLLSG